MKKYLVELSSNLGSYSAEFMAESSSEAIEKAKEEYKMKKGEEFKGITSATRIG